MSSLPFVFIVLLDYPENLYRTSNRLPCDTETAERIAKCRLFVTVISRSDHKNRIEYNPSSEGGSSRIFKMTDLFSRWHA